jgi:uncharacterized membrane protein
MKANPQSQKELTSFGYGFLGVLIFSLTLPATRIAVSGFDPVFVGLGRAIVAAGLSLILLLVTGQTIPPLKFLPNFAITSGRLRQRRGWCCYRISAAIGNCDEGCSSFSWSCNYGAITTVYGSLWGVEGK